MEVGVHPDQDGLRIDEAGMARHMLEVHADLPARIGRDVRYTRPWFERFIGTIFCERLGLEVERIGGVHEELFARFADPKTFHVRDGARKLLSTARDQGLRVALVSNWSDTLEDLVRGLDLTFDTVLSSATVRCEKPQARIFELALRTVDATPRTALHAGDSIANDVDGAAAIGMRAVFVGHGGTVDWEPRPGCAHLTSLHALSFYVTEWASVP